MIDWPGTIVCGGSQAQRPLIEESTSDKEIPL
jgi:hypothetical protein